MLSRPVQIVIRRGRIARFSSNAAPAAAATTTSSSAAPSLSMAEQKRQLAKAALQQVPIYGWTQDAITAAVLQDPKLTISMTGLLTPSDLITMFMEDFNHQLRTDPEKQGWSVYDKLKWRLEQVIPLAQRGQWHTGMAKGLLQTPWTTRSQLHEFIELVAPPGSSLVYQTALGGVFVASELHLLTDSSQDYQATWNFLEARLHELNESPLVTTTSSNSTMVGGMPVAAYTAVAASLLDGIASLILPLHSPTRVPGTNPNDYKPKNKNKNNNNNNNNK